jgi:hypothetical protein
LLQKKSYKDINNFRVSNDKGKINVRRQDVGDKKQGQKGNSATGCKQQATGRQATKLSESGFSGLRG